MKIDLSKVGGGKPSVSLKRKTVLAYCMGLKLGEAVPMEDVARELGMSCNHVGAVIRANNLRFYMVGDDGKTVTYAASPETIAKYTKP